MTAGSGGAGGGGHSGGAGGSYWDSEFSDPGTAGAGIGGLPTVCGGGHGLGGAGWPATDGACQLMSIPFRSNVHVGAGGGGGGGITQGSTDLQGGSGGGAGAAGFRGQGGNGGSGAGGLRIDSATGITIEGAVRADGDVGHEPSDPAAFGGGGGGGVVWLRAPSVAIPGTVEARGGRVAFGSVGNGADGTVVIDTDCQSGAGTVYPDPVVGTFSGAAGIAVDDSYATDEDTTLSVPASGVLDNDCGSSRSASIATTPAHGTLTLQPTGAFTYAPASNWHGTDSFTYSLTADGVASGTATVTIAVAPVNDAPATVGDSYTVPSGSSLTVPSATGVLANDSDLDGDALTAALGTNATHGSLSLAPDGSFTYTPAAGFSGPDSFTYVAHDATAGSAVTTATISVTPLAPTLSASVEPPINADGSSVFAAKRGVVPVKFTPQVDGRPTCDLPAATISLTRIGATTGAVVDEAVYTNPADGGSAFRVSGCQYVYNLSTKALGTGTYRVSILVNGQTIGTATFALR